MYKTAITLPEKIRSKSVAALLAGLVGLTALSMTPLTASAGTPHGTVTVGEIRHVVVKYLTAHPELRQASPAPQAYASATLSISADSGRLRRNPHIRNRETVNASGGQRARR
jgi:hypothetical protein